MSDTTAETTAERKPPTIADIVREKTGDGALIIDFFTDVMTGRIEGAELCHRIDAAKQLVKYGSKDAAEFLAKYKGVPCGHSTGGRPNQTDPCTAEERTLVAVTLNAPATLTKDFLTVLSGIDEFLMARLIRAQTADGDTIIEFLDDVMQDRTDGFKTHHRIAAAKELIVHIIRDEQPSHTPSPLTGEGWGEGDSPVVGADPRVRPLPGSHTPAPSTRAGWGEGDSPVVGADLRVRPLPGSDTPSPLTGEGWGEGDSPVVGADPRVRPLPGSHTPSPSTGEGWGEGDTPVVGADLRVRPLPGSKTPSPLTGEGWGEGDSPVVGADPRVRPLPGSHTPSPSTGEGWGEGDPPPLPEGEGWGEGDSSVVPAPTAVVPAESLPRTRYGAGTHPRDPEPGSQLETLPARPIEQHWHEPHPHGAPIDSTHPGRSPPS